MDYEDHHMKTDAVTTTPKKRTGVEIERVFTGPPPIKQIVTYCRHAYGKPGDRLEVKRYDPIDGALVNQQVPTVAIDMFGHSGRQRVIITKDDLIVLIGALEEFRDQL